MSELTYGQKTVGLTFNPSGNDDVQKIKQAFANAIDPLNNLRNVTTSSEVNACVQLQLQKLKQLQCGQ